MSKNIIIQEGGTNYQFTAKKLRTDKVGGGSVLWVPEEETVLKKIRITEEGTYKAFDEGVYGYSEVKVNVKGGKGSADSSGRPRTTFDSDGNIENAPGGIGSAVVGRDTTGVISGTTGGDNNEYAIGIDDGGNIVATKVPSGIEIGKAPNKTSYTEGETIDYSGIIVILKGGDSAMFSNTDYPNGRVPFSELVFPVSTASSDGSGGRVSPEGFPEFVVTSVSSPAPADIATSSGRQYLTWATTGSGTIGAALKGRDGYSDVIVYSDAPFETSAEYRDITTAPTPNISVTSKNVYKGKEFYYVLIGSTSIECDTNGAENWQIAYAALYGSPSGSGKQTIPVRWSSPYDSRTFEDAFEITVTDDSSSSGSTDGGGYSDDSGGSSSGGGGGF